ncbi:MAG TPA: hypothetical protein VGD07_13100, partial [Methylomirabilota bacterium]
RAALIGCRTGFAIANRDRGPSPRADPSARGNEYQADGEQEQHQPFAQPGAPAADAGTPPADGHGRPTIPCTLRVLREGHPMRRWLDSLLRMLRLRRPPM